MGGNAYGCFQCLYTVSFLCACFCIFTLYILNPYVSDFCARYVGIETAAFGRLPICGLLNHHSFVTNIEAVDSNAWLFIERFLLTPLAAKKMSHVSPVYNKTYITYKFEVWIRNVSNSCHGFGQLRPSESADAIG